MSDNNITDIILKNLQELNHESKALTSSMARIEAKIEAIETKQNQQEEAQAQLVKQVEELKTLKNKQMGLIQFMVFAIPTIVGLAAIYFK